MTTASPEIAALRAVLTEQMELLKDPIEGLADFVRVGNGVDGEQEMRKIAGAAADRYGNRVQLIKAVLVALDGLERDGFPLIALVDVPSSHFELFERNTRTMGAALALLQPFEPATGGEVRFGAGRRRSTLPDPAAPPRDARAN